MSHDLNRARAAAQASVLSAGLEILGALMSEQANNTPIVLATAEETLALLDRLEGSLAAIDALTTCKSSVTDLRRKLQAESRDPRHDPHADEAYLTWARRWRRAAKRWRA